VPRWAPKGKGVNNSFHNLRCWVRSFAALHPSYEELLACHDGELRSWKRWRITRHLERCPPCRKQSALVEEDLDLFRRFDRGADTRGLPNVSQGLVTLRQAIARWEALYESGQAREAVACAEEAWQHEMASELSVYLGTHAQDILRLRLKGQEPEPNLLLAEAESLLCDFFGPRAAAAVARKILYAQALRDARAEGFVAT